MRRQRAGDAEAQQAPRAAGDRRLEIGGEPVRTSRADKRRDAWRPRNSRLGDKAGDDGQRHQAAPSRSSANRAAVWPERIAPSIVAGKPVCT